MCRRLFQIFLLPLLFVSAGGLIAPANAAEEIVFGQTIVARLPGEPEQHSFTFNRPGTFGPPYRLVVASGDASEKTRVSSGWIYLNGRLVLSPSDLNKQIGVISTEIDLPESNSLTVRLASAPGSFLTITILGQRTSEVPNEVSRASVAPDSGATIYVPSTSGGLRGAVIEIPADAALETIEVQVGYERGLPGPFSDEAIAAGVTQVSDTVALKVANGGKSNFAKPVAVTIPYDVSSAEGLPPAIFYWDPTASTYRTVRVTRVDRENGMVTFETSHFSEFVAAVVRRLSALIPDVDTNFRIGVDSILHKNFGSYQFGGHCAAFASMATHYFSLNKSQPLYELAQEGVLNQQVDDELTRTALTLTYSTISSKWASVASSLVFLSERDTGLLILASMIVTGDPLHMVMYSDDRSEGGHSVTVYGYDSALERFRIYDSNFPAEEVTFGWSLLTGFGAYSKAAVYPSGLFDRIGYASDDTFASVGEFQRIISEWETGGLTDYFSNLAVTDENSVVQSLDYGRQVTIQVPYLDNQVVSGQFSRPAGSTNPVYLHVYLNGARQAFVGSAIDASGTFSVSFPNRLEQKVEVMLLVSEDPRDIAYGFSAFGKFTAQPEGRNFFENFGFESGNLSGWSSATTLLNSGATSTPTRATVVSVGNDPIASDIPTVQFGANALRINDSTPSYHVTYAAQSAVVPSGGNPQLRFQWAAVLQDPQHSPGDQPFVQVTVRNVTAGFLLYSRRFYTNDPSFSGWRSYQSGQWKAIPWQAVVVTGLSDYAGDQIELRVTGADCRLGGHGGYVYLDGEE